MLWYNPVTKQVEKVVVAPADDDLAEWLLSERPEAVQVYRGIREERSGISRWEAAYRAGEHFREVDGGGPSALDN